MSEEIWKDIDGYEGYYQVSSLGRVRSLDRTVVNRNGVERFQRGKILIPALNGHGYYFVVLSKNNKQKDSVIHRLVAKAFLPNPDNLPQVNHINEVKTCNRVDNLEYCTQQYNLAYGTGRQRCSRSQLNGKRSKKIYQYTIDGELVNIFPSSHECERNGYNRAHIYQCCIGKYKQHKGYIWRYEPMQPLLDTLKDVG